MRQNSSHFVWGVLSHRITMEDDGLLLNFTVDNDLRPKRPGVKVTGGRWKDRRKLQLQLQGRGRNDKKPKTGVNSIHVDESRLKRINDDVSAPSSLKDNDSKRHKFLETRGEFGGTNNSYVSSLFTSNEKSMVLEAESSKPQQQEITYLPSNAPLKDATTFEELGLNEKLTQHLIENLKFKAPTKVQRSTIPNLLYAKSDLFIRSQTGSGKTLSFLLPIFHKLMQENTHKITRHSGIFAMILVPTRELANQIYSVLEMLSRCHQQIVPGIVIGGEKKKSEKARIRKGVNILVGTPGRLADHIENTQSLDLRELRWLVLDEGDRLVELGFEETITKITDNITKTSQIKYSARKWGGLPTKRINVLCSATMQQNVEKLGNMLLDNPEMITVESKHVGTVEFDQDNTDEPQTETTNSMLAPDQLNQTVIIVPPKLRLVTLNALFKKLCQQDTPKRLMVFLTCSDSVDYHFEVFTRSAKNDNDDNKDNSHVSLSRDLGSNVKCFKLHGTMSQQDRTDTLSEFVKDSNNSLILFCTDVASRGLDLPNISEVIEYDPPFTVEDHLHRVGRSARVGNKGSAYLFLLPGIEEKYIDVKLSPVHHKKLNIGSYEQLLKDGYGETTDSKNIKWDIHATTWHLNIERWLLEDSYAYSKAVSAFTSHIRAYATHLLSEREFFNVKVLHLGHLAKAFGLRETPKKLGRSSNSSLKNTDKPKKLDPKQKMMQMARLAVKSASSEFNY